MNIIISTVSIIERNLNSSIKTKQLFRNNNNNKRKSYSDTGLNRTCCRDCLRSYIRETSRNLLKRINEHRRDFKKKKKSTIPALTYFKILIPDKICVYKSYI